jgi:gas vesicle protein
MALETEYDLIRRLDNSDKYKVVLRLYQYNYLKNIKIESESSIISFNETQSNKIDNIGNVIENGLTSFDFPIMQDKISSEYNYKWYDLEEGQADAGTIIAREAGIAALDAFSGIFTDVSNGLNKKAQKIVETAETITNDENFLQNLARENGKAFTKGLKKVFDGTDFKTFNYEGTLIPNSKDDYIGKIDENGNKIIVGIIDILQLFKLKNMSQQSESNILSTFADTLKDRITSLSNDADIDISVNTSTTETDTKKTMGERINEGKEWVQDNIIDPIADTFTYTPQDLLETLEKKKDEISTALSLEYWAVTPPALWGGYIYSKYYDENGILKFYIIKTIPLSVMSNFKYSIDMKNGFYEDGKPSSIKVSFTLTETVPFHSGTEYETTSMI